MYHVHSMMNAKNNTKMIVFFSPPCIVSKVQLMETWGSFLDHNHTLFMNAIKFSFHQYQQNITIYHRLLYYTVCMYIFICSFHAS